ncbi:hypothetical protein [Candidatus Williamhamiltonella defendens]|nr:hypothetical protein [Candidatus Hamiltonella defensa]
MTAGATVSPETGVKTVSFSSGTDGATGASGLGSVALGDPIPG